ncbi:copper resistance CopC/CopD family protein [Streptomyces marincola]|uniref:copper resistance CopC/CopD family protein n=1 Tax=Streptomyces marincola TaxID=2878388 RepID=UPI001CF0EB8D|nr:copper resistance protein CopC [Streptomyces marincola]UCM89166.1 copper resistance protein CopC [Streptomyces marincola]
MRTPPRFPAFPASSASPAALLLLVASAFALLLLGATPAAAHAELTGTTPGDGEVVATAPEQVTLTFSESVSLPQDAFRVLAPDGEDVGEGTFTDEGGNTWAVPLDTGLGDGTYTVAWHVVSADSHPISGAFTFSIGAPSETVAEVPQRAGDSGLTGLLYDVARYAVYGGFVLMAGTAAFILVCWPGAAALRPVQRLTTAGWATATAATVALLLLRTPYTGSGNLADAFDLGGLRDVIDTRTGTALLTRLLLLAAAGLFLAVLHGSWARPAARDPENATDADEGEEAEDAALRARDLRFGLAVAGVVLAAGTAATWAMSEHAATGRQTGIAIPAHILHLLAVAAWLGGLAALLVLLRTAPALPRAAVRRFSAVALTSVTVLAATGLYQSWRQVGFSWSALTGTSYGRLLILKVVLVALMLGAAWGSRRWTGRLTEDRPATTEAPEDPEEPEDTERPADSAALDGERARQLARQRTAVLRAKERKARDADPHRAGLRRSVLAEAAIAAVLLAVTTVLTGTTPARVADAAPAESAAAPGDAAPPEPIELPFDTGGEWGQGTARLDLSPARTGENALHIRLFDTEGLPTGAVELRVALTLPAEDLGPLRHEPLHVDVGHWTVPEVQLPRPGDWEVALTIRTSEIDQVTETATVTIP